MVITYEDKHAMTSRGPGRRDAMRDADIILSFKLQPTDPVSERFAITTIGFTLRRTTWICPLRRVVLTTSEVGSAEGS